MRLAGLKLAGDLTIVGEPGDPTGLMFLRQVGILFLHGNRQEEHNTLGVPFIKLTDHNIG